MSFGMSEAKQGKEKFDKNNRPRLALATGADGKAVRTPYECSVVNARFIKNEKYGRGFFVDVKVDEDGKPTPRGVVVTLEFWPDTATGNVAQGGKMTPVMAKSLELGKVQRTIGAAFGFDQARSSNEIQDDVLARVLVTEQGKVSSLNGRPIRVDVVPHVKADGKVSSFLEAFPSARIQGAIAAAAPSAPAVPVVPATPKLPTLDELLSSKGLVRHPQAPDSYAYSPTTNEVFTIPSFAGQHA